MTNLQAVPQTGFWSLSRAPFIIDLYALSRIRQEVTTGFHALPYGGLEVGGLLLGSYDGGTVRISNFEPIECEHAGGPGFSLSDKDRAVFVQRLRYHESLADAGGERVVGWYHSHTRSALALSREDLALHNDHFPEPWHVALLLRHYSNGSTEAGFFFEQPAVSAALEIPGRRGFAFEPFVLDLDILTRLEEAAGDATEIGGVLLGEYAGDRLCLTGFEPIHGDRITEPSAAWSEDNEAALARRIVDFRNRPGSENSRIAGWYDRRAQSNLVLSEEAREIHAKYFPEPWQIAVVLLSDKQGRLQAGFYFKEGDVLAVRALAGPAESEIKASSPATPRPREHSPREHSPSEWRRTPAPSIPLNRSLVPERVETRLDTLPRAVAIAPLQLDPSRSEWLKRLESEYRDVKLPGKSERRWGTWMLLAGMFVFSVVAVLFLRTHFSPETSRTAYGDFVRVQAVRRNGNIEVSWDTASLGKVDQGQLDVGDGAISARLILDQNTLAAGKLTYAYTSDVTRFRLHVQRTDGSTLEGSTTYIAPTGPVEQAADVPISEPLPPAVEKEMPLEASRESLRENARQPAREEPKAARHEPEAVVSKSAPPDKPKQPAPDRQKAFTPPASKPNQTPAASLIAQTPTPLPLQERPTLAVPSPIVSRAVSQIPGPPAAATPPPQPAPAQPAQTAEVEKPQMQIGGRWALQAGSASRSPGVPEAVAITVADKDGAYHGTLEARYKSGSKKERLSLSFSGKMVNGVARFPWKSSDGRNGVIEFVRVPNSPNAVEVVWYGEGGKEVFDEIVHKSN